VAREWLVKTQPADLANQRLVGSEFEISSAGFEALKQTGAARVSGLRGAIYSENRPAKLSGHAPMTTVFTPPPVGPQSGVHAESSGKLAVTIRPGSNPDKTKSPKWAASKSLWQSPRNHASRDYWSLSGKIPSTLKPDLIFVLFGNEQTVCFNSV
jgi:hypothetical protein